MGAKKLSIDVWQLWWSTWEKIKDCYIGNYASEKTGQLSPGKKTKNKKTEIKRKKINLKKKENIMHALALW